MSKEADQLATSFTKALWELALDSHYSPLGDDSTEAETNDYLRPLVDKAAMVIGYALIAAGRTEDDG